MKTFKELNIGDKLALISKYDLEYNADTVYDVKNIESSNNTLLIELDTESIFRQKLYSINPNDSYAVDPVNVKYILTPIENYRALKHVFNMGYIIGNNDAKYDIKKALGIFN